MLKKYLFVISICALFLSTFVITFAQESKTEKIDSKITQHDDMQKYMEIIAADSSMRIQMMNSMIKNSEGNENAMMGIGKSMIQNPEMNKVLANLMKDDAMIISDTIEDIKLKDDGLSKEKMKMERTKTIQKPKYDSGKK